MPDIKEVLPFLIPLAIVEMILLAYTLYHILTHKTYKRGNRILWIVIAVEGCSLSARFCISCWEGRRADMGMLELSHVAKNFGEKQVLRDVTFTVPEHTVFGFVGQNGAGKTTAMKLILGLLPAGNGEIRVNGQPVHYGNTPTNRFVGYLPDVPEFYSYMTPAEYLHFCGEIAGMQIREIKSRSEELLCLVGLGSENRRIKGFSRGMKQRLGIAQALFGRPKLLICDEPTSALDPAGRKEVLDILVSVKEETTVLFSTHILSDVEHICDEIAFLHEGKIALCGSLDEVRSGRSHLS